MHPLISIITVTFQAALTLEQTINSVLSQDSLYEYIIIDGGSSDGTVDIIKKYHYAISYWVSEPDKGIYDAMNKGISKASGKWLYFLGADDVLLNDVLSKIYNDLEDEYYIVYGDVSSKNGRRISSFLNKRIFLQNTLHHQGAFYRKVLFEEFRYDSALQIISDYELNLKVYRYNLPTHKISYVIACCEDGGASSNTNLSIKETNFIRKRYLDSRLCNWLLSSLLRLYYFQKRVRILFN